MLVLRVTIDGAGRVTRITIQRASGDDRLDACIVRVLSGVAFPAGTGRPASYPLKFHFVSGF